MSCDSFAQIILSVSSEHSSRERRTKKLQAHNALRMNCDEANSRHSISNTSSWQTHSHSHEIYLNDPPNVGPKFMFLASPTVNIELGDWVQSLGQGVAIKRQRAPPISGSAVWVYILRHKVSTNCTDSDLKIRLLVSSITIRHVFYYQRASHGRENRWSNLPTYNASPLCPHEAHSLTL